MPFFWRWRLAIAYWYIHLSHAIQGRVRAWCWNAMSAQASWSGQQENGARHSQESIFDWQLFWFLLLVWARLCHKISQSEQFRNTVRIEYLFLLDGFNCVCVCVLCVCVCVCVCHVYYFCVDFLLNSTQMGAPFFGTRTDFLRTLCTGKDLARKKVIWSSNSHFAKIEGSDWWIDVNVTSYKTHVGPYTFQSQELSYKKHVALYTNQSLRRISVKKGTPYTRLLRAVRKFRNARNTRA